MYRACIAVVDASRARLFTYQRSHDAGALHEQLTEERDFVNPGRRRRPSELFTDSGADGGRNGPVRFGTDDHRDAHVERLDTEFSRMVAGEPFTGDILKCQLRPLDPADYASALPPVTDADIAALQAVFPAGVCDYSKPGVGQQHTTAWMTYAGGPGGVPMGPPLTWYDTSGCIRST